VPRGASAGIEGARPLSDRDDERRQRFERYLLGTLDDRERAAVREVLIHDPDAFAEMREIELDLLDAAARGSLGLTRGEPAIERLVTASHNRDASVLALALAERRAREQGGWSWRWSVAWPAAAALVAAVGLGLFALRTTPADRAGAATPPGGTVSRDRQPPLNSGSSSSSAAASAPSPAAPNASPSSSPGGPANAASRPATASPDAARMVALFLPAGTLRGVRPTLRVPREAETVRLEIEIESPAPAFVTVTLRAVSETADAVWTAARVPVRADRGQRIAIVIIPARVLPAGAIEAHITTPERAASAPPASTAASTPIRVIPFLVRRD
jgi:hypothetical protein